MRELTIIKQGESLDFNFDRGDNGIDGWTCTIHVKRKSDDAASITRVISASGESWPGYLTQTETAALAIGMWHLIAKLENTSTDEEEQEVVRFRITKPWA